eukprot:314839-Pyramimonas_sp.AAC.1
MFSTPVRDKVAHLLGREPHHLLELLQPRKNPPKGPQGGEPGRARPKSVDARQSKWKSEGGQQSENEGNDLERPRHSSSYRSYPGARQKGGRAAPFCERHAPARLQQGWAMQWRTC